MEILREQVFYIRWCIVAFLIYGYYLYYMEDLDKYCKPVIKQNSGDVDMNSPEIQEQIRLIKLELSFIQDLNTSTYVGKTRLYNVDSAFVEPTE